MRRTLNLNSISAVNAGQKTTIRIVDALAYHGIMLLLTNLTAANLTLIRCFLNDKEFMSFTGADLDSMCKYFGFEAYDEGATDQLFIPFAGPGLLDQAQEEGTAIHLGVPYKDGTLVQSMRIEIDIAAGVVSPGIAAQAIVRDAQAGREPWFPFCRASNIDVQSGGIKNIPDVVDIRSAREAFVAEVFFKSANLTQLSIQRNSVDMFDRIKAVNERIQKNGVRVPQAGFFAFDARENGYGDAPDALAAAGASTLNWKLYMSGAETFPAYVWTIGPLQ